MKLEELRQLLAENIRGLEFDGTTYFAGGCVRDLHLGRPAEVKDVDIAVELPDGGIRLAVFLQEYLPTPEPEYHSRFGTASSRFQGVQLDFAMTRSEVYIPGNRFPRVEFAELTADCLRRDFTVNALYQDVMSGWIVDPSGKGIADIMSNLIRCVRDPILSFQEDPLRLLRALRFAAVLGFDIESDTYEALKDNAPLVLSLSQRRCQDEQARLEAKASFTARQRWLRMLDETGIRPHLEKKVRLD
ncbi:MAG: CCA tRNA nucleotidyltransferase [Candidatus Syntrophosphaera sp.]|nr:CCA tRNA nucleotidyltransferase [Candidatus Syntrophosphaera sp.]